MGTISRQERENIELVKEFIFLEAQRAKAIKCEADKRYTSYLMVKVSFDLMLGLEGHFTRLECAEAHLLVNISHEVRYSRTSYILNQRGSLLNEEVGLLQSRIQKVRELECRWGHAARTLKLPQQPLEHNRGYYTRHGNLLHVSF